jgi:ankyrin repeat protein
MAAEHGYKEIAELLLAKGADINLDCGYNGTALFTAIRSGKEEMVEFLINAGADVHAGDGSGATLLAMAAMRGQRRTVELLMAKAVGINAVDTDGGTALHALAYHGDPNFVEWFLGLGAGVNAKDKDGHTPLYSAASRFGYFNESAGKRVIEILLAHGAKIQEDRTGLDELLYFAAGHGFTDLAERVFAMGVTLNASKQEGGPALLAALADDNRDLAVLLINHGADVNVKNWKGATPLHDAARAGDKELAAMLLAHHANVHAKNESGSTALHEAVDSGYAAVVELLIANGADVNAVDDNGNTALHYAARGHKEIAEFLLEQTSRDTAPQRRPAGTHGYRQVVAGPWSRCRTERWRWAYATGQGGGAPAHRDYQAALQAGGKGIADCDLSAKVRLCAWSTRTDAECIGFGVERDDYEVSIPGGRWDCDCRAGGGGFSGRRGGPESGDGAVGVRDLPGRGRVDLVRAARGGG